MNLARFYVFLWLILLVACSPAPDDEEKTPIPTITATDSTSLQLLELEAPYEELRQLHAQLSDIWEGLAQGELQTCSLIDISISPAQFSDAVSPERELRQATLELQAAALLWETECQRPRENIPQEVISEGVLIVRAAGDALFIVEVALSNR